MEWKGQHGPVPGGYRLPVSNATKLQRCHCDGMHKDVHRPIQGGKEAASPATIESPLDAISSAALEALAPGSGQSLAF
jgi:hypothetical protein